MTELISSTVKDCSCSARQADIGDGSLETFAAVRSSCPVLRHIFVPDETWLEFQKWHRQKDSVARHRSILLLAMQRGYLGRVTSAVHRYLITGGLPRPDLRRQYVMDLRERWMYYSNPVERHQKFRIFFGRLVELKIAEWLESEGWTVSGLEAFREGPDIEACAADGRVTAFEVKFIGMEDADFGVILKSLTNQPAATSVSPYAAANYLLFRAYEAAKQLQKISSSGIAVLVVDDLTWFRFDLQIRGNWIDWTKPKFFAGDDAWEAFLACQKTRYPQLTDDLQPALGSLKAVWIFRQSSGYQYDREVEISIHGA